MARRRMIDPNFWQSEDVSQLSILARYLFVGLFSNADDEGKGRANPNYVKSIVFPYDDIEASEVDKALSEISLRTSVRIYQIEGQKYYKFDNWSKWQKVDKPSKSVIPEPFDDDSPNHHRTFAEQSPNPPRTFDDESRLREEKRIEDNTPLYIPPLEGGDRKEETVSNTDVCSSIQQVDRTTSGDSTSNQPSEDRTTSEDSVSRQPKEKKKGKGVPEDRIDEFFVKTWTVYPRKVSKVQARKTYGKKLAGMDLEEARTKANKIFLLLKAHIGDWEDNDREIAYIPYFSTWLNENIEDSPHKRRR